MTDYQIEANTRRCCSTGRELRPGEKYYSILQDEAGVLQRRDFSYEAWQGPSANAIGFWTGKIPAGEARPRKFDDEILAESFDLLEEEADPGRASLRYVMSLLLLRRKRLRFDQAHMEGDQEVMTLHDVQSGKQYRVANPGLNEDQMTAVQEEVFRLIGQS